MARKRAAAEGSLLTIPKRLKPDLTSTGKSGELKRGNHCTLKYLSDDERRSCPEIIVDTESSLIDGGLLESFLFPITSDYFFTNIWKQQAFACINGDIERMRHIISNELHELDVEALLENTASEHIFVWMKSKSSTTNTNTISNNDGEHATHIKHLNTSNEGGKLSSFELESSNPGQVTAAKICYDSGASLYFRSPEEMSKTYVNAMTNGVGINFAGMNPSDSTPKGEIEIFLSRTGHVTDWHFDFMENFTFQLKGR
jgi:hypothetical protein